MAANASAHSDLVTLHTNLHTLLIKLSLSLHLTSPSYTPTPQLATSPSNRLSTQRSPPLNDNYNHNYTYKNNPHDPLEVLYTLSPPSFHYLPRSTLLPPQILRKGFIETPENNPPLLEGTRMQIMVIPRGVRKIVVHFLVYDPVLKGTEEQPKVSPLFSQVSKEKKEGPKKLRKKASRVLNPQEKIRDFPTKRRSTSQFAYVDVDANAYGKASGTPGINQNRNFDGMEIEVMGKRQVSEMDVERVEDREGEYVVMRRVVKLPRRVWCGRNVSFSLLF
ncbi:hypothetical protein BOTNAR_0531g00080 [Botryotinia narcissicola]|uniref:Uncharacterized protein n=1 Tax=Botryotinia narcissicola TaxID=278944 RepID=A0A4Z1HE11_9HELO|nr:hypothetical protein BOTNAR_0531g00080 [Botryotinia narcissicola]